MSRLPKSLILLFTLKCPLECKHCIVDSNPRRSEGLAPDSVIRLIDEAAAAGIKTIGFTGGDPFVRRADLQRFVARVTKHEMQTVIVTSAFWASSEDQAVRILELFRGIYMLGISTDSYHQQFTSACKIRNAIRAAKRLNVPRIELQVTYLSPESIQPILDELGEDTVGITVRKQKVWPVGQAAALLSGHEAALVAIDDLDFACPMGAPVVTPDGKLKGCCSALLNLGESNPIIIGDVLVDGLAVTLDKAQKHPHYVFLKEFGLRPLVEIVRRSSLSGKLKPAYSDVCHLCHDLHVDPHVRHLLVDTISTAYTTT